MVRFTQEMADEEAPPSMTSSKEEEKVPEDGDDDTSGPLPILHKRGDMTRGLSTVSEKYDLSGTGKLNVFERIARKGDVDGTGAVDPKYFVMLAKGMMGVAVACFILLATTVGSGIGLYSQSQQQGNALVHTIEENAVT